MKPTINKRAPNKTDRAPKQPVRWMRFKDVVADPVFSDLLSKPSPAKREELKFALFQEGCRKPLLAWARQGKLILLTGYDILPLLRKYRLKFPVRVMEFASRDNALMYTTKYLLQENKLTLLEVCYLRGLRYHDEKNPHGGDRKSPDAKAVFEVAKTAPVLAEMLYEKVGIVRRDGEFASAVNKIVAVCGADVKDVLLGRESKLKRSQIHKLAKMEPGQQRRVVFHLRLNGKVPEGLRQAGDQGMITVPKAAEALVGTLQRRLRPEQFLEVAAVMARVACEVRQGGSGMEG